LPKYVEYGYAATIHKSQGGEYPHVITIVPRNIKFTFGKPALYTAFTRAKQSLTIIGALDIMPDILEDEGKRRITVLKSMLSLPLRNVPRERSIEASRAVAQNRLAALMARMGGDKSGADDGWDGDRG
jgi:superfamily I DNA and RNA helicase